MRLVAVGLVLAGVVSVVSSSGASAAFEARGQAGSPSAVRQAQVLEQDRTGVASPVGLAFSSSSNAFYVVGARLGALPETDVVKLTPFSLSPTSDRAGSARIAAAVKDPANMAYDVRRNRLLLLDNAGRLLEVRADANGDLDPKTLVRRDALRLDLQDPQGMTVDSSGSVFILDAGQPRIVRVAPDAAGSFETGAASEIDLRPTGLTGVRGLAFDPSSGHLHVGAGKTLVELTTAGEMVATRDLSGLDLANPEGMVFAPSGDQTDDPGQLSVYVADSGGRAGGSPAAPQSSGQILELSLTPLAAAAASTFTSSLVNTVDTAKYSPPSPDPSGLTYLPASNTLLMSDGEVEEVVNGITHFAGANLWETTLSGSVVRTANISKVAPTVVPMTNEPTGVTWQPATGHYFFSDDGAKRVFDLDPGPNGQYGTADDTWASFSTTANGNNNGDPEGVAYDTVQNHVFVADGVNAEIYEYTTAGVLIGHFDVLTYGVADPETVEFNPVSGTLFVLSNRPSGPIIVETTISGALLQTVNVSAAGARKPAGLAYAPASNGSGAKRFYFVDRGIDNNSDPNIVDGKMYELTAPSQGPPANQLAFATAPQTLTAGIPSGPMAVQLQTSSGTAQTATSPVTVNLSSSSAQGAFSASASGPWTSTLSVTIPAGSSTSGSFYYLDTKAGSPTLTASAAGATSITQTESVNPGPLAGVAVSPSSASVVLGGTQTVTASGADAYGNPLPIASASWSVSAGTPGTVSPTSGNPTTFTASSTTTGSGSVIATVATATGSLSGSASVTVLAAQTISVFSITYATQRQHLLVTATLLDSTGKPVPGASVSISLYLNGSLYRSASGTTGTDGKMTFKATNAPAGCYTTTVTNVAASGFTWDGTTPANQFCT